MRSTYAAWREREAQSRDVPRNRVLNDENIVEIAAHVPETAEALAQCRGWLTRTLPGVELRIVDALQAALPADPSYADYVRAHWLELIERHQARASETSH